VVELLEAQAGVVARWQLPAAGLAWGRREVRGRRWQRVGRCFVAHNGPLSQLQWHWVAVLNAGATAALAGRTAAAAGGLIGWRDQSLHVLVQRGASSPPALPNVVVHWTRHEVDLHPVALPPRVKLPVALLQASSWMRSDRGALGVLAAGVQQRLVRPSDLRDAATSMRELRRRRLVTATVDDLAGGAQALSEIDAVRVCRRAELPPPTQQSVRTHRRGRRRYLDLAWDGWGLSAEIDGFQHMEIRQWCDDLLRQNELVIARTDVLRFPSLLIRTEPQTFTDQIARALLQRGWAA
jgi:hypothetical protein